MFTTGGTLSLGQITPGLSVSIAMGDFIGYIDEVRVWSRPHNPTIITNNFHVIITADTSDVAHNWNFNEGIDLTAYDDKQSENMVAINSLQPPTWVKSDIDLTEDKDLDAPKLTTEDELSAAEILAAQELCSSLINEFSLSISGSTIEVLTEVFEALCVQEITSTGDIDQAAAILAGAADMFVSVENSTASPLESMCNDLGSISEYIGASGENCTKCFFGIVQNTTCICLDTHWGTTCSDICPVGSLGACNMYGLCDAGVCNCNPRHYTTSHSVVDFWTGYIESSLVSISSDYTCDTCSENWVGKDCHFAKSLQSSYSGIIYGSYISTFDGISFTHVAPGVYTLVKASAVVVQALFLPCTGTNTCRYMKELAIVFESTTVIIQHNPGENITLNLAGMEIQYPNTTTSGGIQVQWTKELFIQISFGGSEIVLYDTDIGLITFVSIESTLATSNAGLLGKADESWTNDMQCADDTGTLAAEDMTGNYAGKCIIELYVPDISDVIITNEYASEKLSSGGFALSLSAGLNFTASGFTVEQSLVAFTISFWAKSTITSKKRSMASYVLVSSDVGTALTFQVNSGFLEFDWSSTETTSLAINPNIWYYISFSWQSSDGAVVIYLMTGDTSESASFTGINVGATVNVTQISVSGSLTAMVTIDCTRTWMETKTDQEASDDMNSYCGAAPSDTSLMLSISFDEGEGSTSLLTTYATNAGSTSGLETGTHTVTISGNHQF